MFMQKEGREGIGEWTNNVLMIQPTVKDKHLTTLNELRYLPYMLSTANIVSLWSLVQACESALQFAPCSV